MNDFFFFIGPNKCTFICHVVTVVHILLCGRAGQSNSLTGFCLCGNLHYYCSIHLKGVPACLTAFADGQNLNSPSFGVQPKTFTVSELAAVGDDVFRCQATDDDTGLAATLRFSIVGQCS